MRTGLRLRRQGVGRPELLGCFYIFAARITRFLGRERTAKGCVQDTGLIPVGTGDHGDRSDLARAPITETADPLPATTNLFAAFKR